MMNSRFTIYQKTRITIKKISFASIPATKTKLQKAKTLTF